MKICIFGAGAIGGYLAGFLHRSGAAVSVVARGAHLKAIQERGLTVELADGSSIHARLPASDDPTRLGIQDAVIVTVKAPSLPSVADSIGPLLGPDTPVAFLTNGIPWWYFLGRGGPDDGKSLARLDPGDRLRAAIGAERLVGGVIWPASSVPAPGHIKMVSGNTRGTFLGRPDGSTTPGLEALAEAFRAAGLPITVTPTIRNMIWEKVAFNLSAGPMCVLTRSPVRATYEEPVLIETSRRVMGETLALIQAMGCAIEFDVERVVATNLKLGHRPSVLQDLAACRPMEIDALYTVPLELAASAGVPMPTLALLAALIRVRAREDGLYPR
ncbi:MAG: 2-dehydropantoate 2-reductase [Proteobacteria bacterium]|nr:2-dehydropantoate 2-reductase [Pseudomonadota bacterium]MBI3496690.1 2-dehydropantoate 2-reductase [Pseudomonadota bacterium]